MSTEDLREVLRRYFDSIIHFCRSAPGCWDRKTGGKKGCRKNNKYFAHGHECSAKKSGIENKIGILHISNTEARSLNHCC